MPSRRVIFPSRRRTAALAVLFSCVAIVTAAAAGARPVIHRIQLADITINPATAEYISDAIDNAETARAEALIIELDTPGGLLNSTRSIVKKILASRVPVIVYIAPPGARAGSAGVFITYAAHLAAMAPSTNIGAAHPVQMGPGGGEPDEDGDFWDAAKELIKRHAGPQEDEQIEGGPAESPQDAGPNDAGTPDKPAVGPEDEMRPDRNPMSSKILQDTVAFIRALAQARGRNVEWGIQSVRKSSSITADEALELGVVEWVAADLNELLEKIDGREVVLASGPVTLHTAGAEVETQDMNFRQVLLNILADPNLAYILMILGFYGLLYEVTHPGLGVPGFFGALFLILAFFSMQTLPVNYAGVALLVLGLALFVLEALTPGIGLPAVGGIICMTLGSVMMFKSPEPFMRVSLVLVGAVTLGSAATLIVLIRSLVSLHRRRATTGESGLIGASAVVRKAIGPGTPGKVFVHGELWNAVSSRDCAVGTTVVVRRVDGLTLTVDQPD